MEGRSLHLRDFVEIGVAFLDWGRVACYVENK
jgi:hypothetical protein